MPGRPRLGQHFLTDQHVLERIAAVAADPGDTVLEIGPGRGALTVHLVRSARRVVAVEVDHALASELPSRCAHPPNLEVLHQDILRVDWNEVLEPTDTQPLVVAGNLPYYITSPVLRKVFRAGRSVRAATFLIQEEVADRVVARPGGKSFGYLSCLCQLSSRPAKLFCVPPAAFSPPPRVNSALVRFEMLPAPPQVGLLDFLAACFRNPRKTLRNNLSRTYPRAQLDEDPCAGLRAQQLGVEELAAMWRRLDAKN